MDLIVPHLGHLSKYDSFFVLHFFTFLFSPLQFSSKFKGHVFFERVRDESGILRLLSVISYELLETELSILKLFI